MTDERKHEIVPTIAAPVAQEPMAFYIYKETAHRLGIQNVVADSLPWVYDQDPSSGFSARLKVYLAPPDQSAEVERLRAHQLRTEQSASAIMDSQQKRIAELGATIEAQRTLYANCIKISHEADELEHKCNRLERQQAVLVEALEEAEHVLQHTGCEMTAMKARAALASVKGNAEVTGVTTGENDAT